MFIDVDFPAGGQSAGGLMRRLFSKNAQSGAEARGLEQVQAWLADQPGVGVQVYRTCAGLRCLVTSQTFDPAAPKTIELLRGIGSDPLYVRLCQSQACFRARLTPKPWRCGSSMPSAKYPRLTPQAQSLFSQWQTGYEQSIRRYCVCRRLGQFGPAEVHPEISLIQDIHDRITCEQPDLPLA